MLKSEQSPSYNPYTITTLGEAGSRLIMAADNGEALTVLCILRHCHGHTIPRINVALLRAIENGHSSVVAIFIGNEGLAAGVEFEYNNNAHIKMALQNKHDTIVLMLWMYINHESRDLNQHEKLEIYCTIERYYKQLVMNGAILHQRSPFSDVHNNPLETPQTTPVCCPLWQRRMGNKPALQVTTKATFLTIQQIPRTPPIITP